MLWLKLFYGHLHGFKSSIEYRYHMVHFPCGMYFSLEHISSILGNKFCTLFGIVFGSKSRHKGCFGAGCWLVKGNTFSNGWFVKNPPIFSCYHYEAFIVASEYQMKVLFIPSAHCCAYLYIRTACFGFLTLPSLLDCCLSLPWMWFAGAVLCLVEIACSDLLLFIW